VPNASIRQDTSGTMSTKAPYILAPTDASKGRPATLIFLHGYGDDAEGLPLGVCAHVNLFLERNFPRLFALPTVWRGPKSNPDWRPRGQA